MLFGSGSFFCALDGTFFTTRAQRKNIIPIREMWGKLQITLLTEISKLNALCRNGQPT